ncbi:hypothetical protein HYH03_014931 [Edaphochlamys debaryana]|uniref:Nucleotide-diphospho-sugar transferase domain-containing protein n=1 Tax=Edaphochlamys debaryana TaxID=47281 RepID=A0A835XSZ6_9CHLO|nr:hypothetical protein HYH03_014931 [Edaphochlamys debaryana]|eukprot:KAG2486350.1 hypothetical protein HYH03_014931 [Edaphochlamys debaryana]
MFGGNLTLDAPAAAASLGPASGPGAGASGAYVWQSEAWNDATWAKVRAVHGLVAGGYCVLHSDVDASWLRDPAPLLDWITPPAGEGQGGQGQGEGGEGGLVFPAAAFSHDGLVSPNPAGPAGALGLELGGSPYYNLNTGVYWVAGSAQGAALMRAWLAVREASFPGHDQQALNLLVRGAAAVGHGLKPRGYVDPPPPRRLSVPRARLGRLGSTPWGAGGGEVGLWAAPGAPGVPGGDAGGALVGVLAVSSFSHTYAFGATRLHTVRQHPLYEVHWVWGGRSVESKRAAMREAGAAWDPPAWYAPERVLTFELEHDPLPPGYNSWPASRTDDMVTFALGQLNAQLQQTYWALGLALATNRTLVLPRFQCYCARGWYRTTACRIGDERDTQFPFNCTLSHLLRAKRLAEGHLRLHDPLLGGGGGGGGWRVAEVREAGFMDNPRTDPGLKAASRLVLTLRGAAGGAAATSLSPSAASPSASPFPAPPPDQLLPLDAPLSDRTAQALLGPRGPHAAARVLHVPRPPGVFARGFEDGALWAAFDAGVQGLAATWCCRAQGGPGPRRERLQPLPESRRGRAVAGAVAGVEAGT